MASVLSSVLVLLANIASIEASAGISDFALDSHDWEAAKAPKVDAVGGIPACSADTKKYCGGTVKTLECLEENHKALTNDCLFDLVKILPTSCKLDRERFCTKAELDIPTDNVHPVTCLEIHLSSLEQNCRLVVKTISYKKASTRPATRLSKKSSTVSTVRREMTVLPKLPSEHFLVTTGVALGAFEGEVSSWNLPKYFAAASEESKESFEEKKMLWRIEVMRITATLALCALLLALKRSLLGMSHVASAEAPEMQGLVAKSIMKEPSVLEAFTKKTGGTIDPIL